VLSLKLVLDSLYNDFSDNRIIEEQIYTDAVITDGKITVSDINTVFPINCYIKVSGTVFNNNFFKITGSGVDYIEAAELKEDPIQCIKVKACFIPDEVINFTTIDHKVPTLDSEKIGNYSYNTSTPGVESFIRRSLSPYYQGVRI